MPTPEVPKTNSQRAELPSRQGQVMYNATVRALPFAEQCRAASLAGCGALTMTPAGYLALLTQGLTTRELRAIAADHGVAITHLDPLARWTPRWIPDNYQGNYDLAMIAFDIDDFLRMTDALGCRSFTALGTHPAGSLRTDELVDHFGALCRRAAVEGLRVDLEFAPLWGLATLEQAWDVVRGVDAANSGIMFDMWHFHRSSSSAALLAQIPGFRITGVQLNDGDAELPMGRTLIEDCLFCRMPPGAGDFRVRDIVAILRASGGLNHVGPEIFSRAFDSLGAEEIAERSVAAMTSVLSLKDCID
jgi:sugar phosphate isomerase/epimerase